MPAPIVSAGQYLAPLSSSGSSTVLYSGSNSVLYSGSSGQQQWTAAASQREVRGHICSSQGWIDTGHLWTYWPREVTLVDILGMD